MSWTACVRISQGVNGMMHVIVQSTGDDNLEALAGAAKVAGMLSEGRETVVRAVPSATSEPDFATGVERHRGFARFTLTGNPEAVEDEAA